MKLGLFEIVKVKSLDKKPKNGQTVSCTTAQTTGDFDQHSPGKPLTIHDVRGVKENKRRGTFSFMGPDGQKYESVPSPSGKKKK